MKTLGIDIGGTNIRLGLVDQSGAVSGFERYSTPEQLNSDPPRQLAELTAAYLEQHKDEKICAVCAGFPAAVDKSREVVLNAPNVAGFDGVNMKRVMSRYTALPFYVERDVNLLLLCDLRRLKIASGDIIACYIGTGIGNAIMLGGRLYCGSNGVAGELGHIPFGDSNEVCGCGNSGCAELVCGGAYLAKLRRERFPQTDIADLFVCHGDSIQLCEYIERLGRVIATEINIIDPEVLLLGGGVIEMRSFPRERLAEAVRRQVRKPLPNDNLRIIFTESAGDSGVVGAGLYAFQKLQKTEV